MYRVAPGGDCPRMGSMKSARGYLEDEVHVKAEKDANDNDDHDTHDVGDQDRAVDHEERIDVPNGSEGVHHAVEHGHAHEKRRNHAVKEKEQKVLVVEEANAVAHPEAVVVPGGKKSNRHMHESETLLRMEHSQEQTKSKSPKVLPLPPRKTTAVHFEDAFLAHRAVVHAVWLEGLTLPAVARVAVALALGDRQRLDRGAHVGRLEGWGRAGARDDRVRSGKKRDGPRTRIRINGMT